MDFLNSPLWHGPACSHDVIRVRPLLEWHRRTISTRWLSFFVIPPGPQKSVLTTGMASICCQSSRGQSSSHLNPSHPRLTRRSSGRGERKSKEVSVRQYDVKSFIPVLNWGSRLFTHSACPTMWARDGEGRVQTKVHGQGNHSPVGRTVGGMTPWLRYKVHVKTCTNNRNRQKGRRIAKKKGMTALLKFSSSGLQQLLRFRTPSLFSRLQFIIIAKSISKSNLMCVFLKMCCVLLWTEWYWSHPMCPPFVQLLTLMLPKADHELCILVWFVSVVYGGYNFSANQCRSNLSQSGSYDVTWTLLFYSQSKATPRENKCTNKVDLCCCKCLVVAKVGGGFGSTRGICSGTLGMLLSVLTLI